MDKKSKFLLLQVNDALFPIGGYSHSYGLETYIQKELVTNAAEAEAYIRNKLTQNLLYNELSSAVWPGNGRRRRIWKAYRSWKKCWRREKCRQKSGRRPKRWDPGLQRH